MYEYFAPEFQAIPVMKHLKLESCQMGGGGNLI